MKVLSSYLKRNKGKVKQIFDSNCKDQELPATKFFSFLQQVLSSGNISFTKEGKQFFKSEDNQNKVEKIIQRYYKTTPDGKNNKFFLYRINFSFEEFLAVMEYWFKVDKSLVVHDPLFQQESSSGAKAADNQLASTTPQDTSKQAQKLESEPQGQREESNSPQNLMESAVDGNEFIVDEQRKQMLIAAYQGEIKKMEQALSNVQNNEKEAQEIVNKISTIRNKILHLSTDREKPKIDNQLQRNDSPLSPKKPRTEGDKQKKAVNFKALFDFYARQNHFTGAKVSFDRIEHESQTINYQKLVHFLKQYDLFPQKPREQKKIHNLYVRSCSNTRDLHYSEFMELLIKLPQIVIQNFKVPPQFKFDALVAKIQSKQEKNKLLHNPFHSLEKDDFRIDKSDLKYSFKIKPVNGKLESEITAELETRKKQKQSLKLQYLRDKELQKIKKLKKMQAIDPYHPMVVKNSHLLAQKSISMREPPVANLDNMERFRDASFDMKSRFGIVDLDDDPMKAVNRYDVDRRLQQMEREESLKMSNLMSSIIERSEAKLAKLGLSPRRRR